MSVSLPGKTLAIFLSFLLIVTGVDLSCLSAPRAFAAGAAAASGSPAAKAGEGEAAGDPADPSVPTDPVTPEQTTDTEQPDPQPAPAPTPEPLAAPVILQPANVAEGISVSWEPLENASTYYLYRKVKSGSWEKIATIPPEESSADGAGDADSAPAVTPAPGAATFASPSTIPTTYLDTAVEPGIIYYYRVRARSALDNSLSPYSEKPWCRRLLPPTAPITATAPLGIDLTWEASAGAGGYRIYRQPQGSTAWTLAGEVTSGTVCSFTDTAAPNGTLCRYLVAAFYKTSESLPGSPSAYHCYVAAPAVKSLKRKTTKSYLVKWSKNAKAAGYQVQYSTSSLFTTKKTVKVTAPGTCQLLLSGLKAKKTYYVRVRAYAKAGGKTYYSTWARSSNAAVRTLASSLQKRGKKVFELRAFAKQKMYAYDTVQGSCTDGTYGYFCLYNRKLEKCKIAKVRLSTNKVVKVSGVLEVAHGNDIAYDSARKRLVVVHSTRNGRRLSVVSPSTLKVTAVTDVAIPTPLPGATDAQRKGAKAFSAIAYNAKRDQFAVLLSSSHDFLLLDASFRPVRYVPATSKSTAVYQGIDATNDHLLVAVSPRSSSQYNAVLAYTWDGVYQGKVNLKKLDEVESIYHVGSKYYVSVYRSYYKVTYKKVKKKVRVYGRYKTKIVKVRERKYARDNYIYKVSGF